MPGFADDIKRLVRGHTPASRGYGPLLQRDYWAVIDKCTMRPSEIIDLLAAHFGDFSPPQFVGFRRLEGHGTLKVGDELDVSIRLTGHFRVRVLHRDLASITLGTLEGHPEAGRITFGAYRNRRKDVIFHIRSIARSSEWWRYLGFIAAGEPMQTNTWTDFVNRVAVTVGEGVIGYIHADTDEVREEPDSPDDWASPTFVARAD